MRVAVIGGGNGSFAAAADLARRGHEVRLWRRDRRVLDPLIASPTITVRDAGGTVDVPIAGASADIADAVCGAEVIVAPVPATAQASVADVLAPHLEPGQVVFIPPGSFGSYVMRRRLDALGGTAEVTFVEAGTLPYLARKHGPTLVAISGRTTRLPVGAMPSARSERALELVGRLYPEVEPLADTLDAALMNAGPVIHAPLVILNAAPIEHFDAWDIHNEGTQPAVRSVQDALDQERIAIRQALGYGPPHFPLADHYSPQGDEWMYGNRAHERLVASSDWREPVDLHTHRYVLEDMACGLALMVSIGDWSGVPCPVATGLLSIASALVGDDLRSSGRTFENLGLAGLSREELERRLRDGATTSVGADR